VVLPTPPFWFARTMERMAALPPEEAVVARLS
jgi:hypothetical protein